jgi:WD40 repeat protein
MKFSILFTFIFIFFLHAFNAQQPYVLLDTKNDHKYPVEIIVIAPDNQTMLSGDGGGNVFFWDLTTMQVIAKIKAHANTVNSILFNTRGDKFVTAGDDGKVKVFDYQTRKLLQTFSAPYDRINFGVLTPDDQYVYFGGYALYSLGQFTGLLKANMANPTRVTTVYEPSGVTTRYGITDGILDYSQKYIMFSMGYGVMIWDFKTDRLVDALWTGYYVNNITSLPQWVYGWCDGKIVRWKWNGTQYKFDRMITTANTNGMGYSRIVFNSDQSIFLTGDESRRVQIYKTETMSLQQVLASHTDVVRTFQFWNHDSIILTGGYDGKIKIWGFPKPEKDSTETTDEIVEIKDTVITNQEIIEEKDTVSTEEIKTVEPEKPKVEYAENNIPLQVDGRKVEKQGEFTVSQLEFEIEVWDNSVYDGDIISLNINGNWVLENYEVTKTPLRIKIKIQPSTNNYLILYAHNLGKIPPNTAVVALIEPNGKKRRLVIKSDLGTCGALNFTYQPTVNQ